MVRRVGVAILGLGTIGSAVVRLLTERRGRIAERFGVDVEVRAILERGPERAARVGLPESIVVTEIEPVLADDRIHVVVEVLGREQPAARHMEAALRSGKHVVTANKEALAKHFAELSQAADASDRALLFEASVGGGIPLMAAYRQLLVANEVTAIRGILNGTTNFILTRMAEGPVPYDVALSEAQELGYAEPDPTSDVEGFDAAYKLAILATLMTGRHVLPEEVNRTGITGITPEHVTQVHEKGATLKLVASAERQGDSLVLRVAPEVVPMSDPLAHVRANLNAIEIVGDQVGSVVLTGQGAGPAPTASAIVSDVIEAVVGGRWAGLGISGR